MGNTLSDISRQLETADKKVQLIYAFNGSGKTRLSREFKEHIAPDNGEDESEERRTKILYYNAFTTDLFYWDNDLDGDCERKLKIQKNTFTDWILVDEGKEQRIVELFQHYTNNKLTSKFIVKYESKHKDGKEIKVATYPEIIFTYERGNEERNESIKISKGEESCFIWSIFYSLLEQVVEVLNVADPNDRETDKFNSLEYIFIDDPVSSLDENHLIELAVDVAELIKSSVYTTDAQGKGHGLKFIVTTHNPLFYNILCNEFTGKDASIGWKDKHWQKYRLARHEDGSFDLEAQPNDSPFSYHLFLKAELDKAADSGEIRKYHFNFLRNILEKTSTFVGNKRWEELLPSTDSGRANPYMNRILNLASHSKHSGEEVAEPNEDDKRVFKFLVQKLNQMYQLKMRSE